MTRDVALSCTCAAGAKAFCVAPDMCGRRVHHIRFAVHAHASAAHAPWSCQLLELHACTLRAVHHPFGGLQECGYLPDALGTHRCKVHIDHVPMDEQVTCIVCECCTWNHEDHLHISGMRIDIRNLLGLACVPRHVSISVSVTSMPCRYAHL